MTTNPIIEVDEDAGAATCRWGHLPLAGDYYTVLQQTEELPLQTIVAGRYHTALSVSTASGTSPTATSHSSTWSATSAVMSLIPLLRRHGIE